VQHRTRHHLRFTHLRHAKLLRILATALLMAAVAPAEAAAQQVDHSAFDRLLRAHVDEQGMVDYDAFARAPEFRRYLDALSRVDLAPLPQNERLALWINAYNAYTIELINRHEERRSIRNINRTLGFIRGKGPWSEPMATVAGHTYTLDEIEHEIIRVRFDEPRIHFALVCAAIGCPPLRREAYTGSRLDAQLEEQTRIFLLQSPEKNRIDVQTRRAHLSPIFRWYGEDFGRSDEEIGQYLARYFTGMERTLLRNGNFRIEYTPYDWSLNSQANAHRAGR
jgi:hypothetical protein